MSVVSNLYAARLYSEHPIAIWPLDDDVSYISLIDNQQRTFEVGTSPYPGWAITNGSANDDLPAPDKSSPFDSDVYAGIQGNIPLSSGTVIEAISPDIFAFNECSEELETFCISMFVYQDSSHISKYEMGYKYYDNSSLSWVEVLTEFVPLERSGWSHLQDTFTVQEFDSDFCRLIFRATVNIGGGAGDYNFIFNGITVGQWSEPYTSSSLGVIPQSAPLSSGLSLDSIPADQYGLLDDNAYYLADNGNLFAKNVGIPMIFGSENVTKLYPSGLGTPSLIFPNKKMFTASGKYKDFTLESWIKIRPITKESRRILGPLDTDDGVYVTEGFITLVIDKKFVSHNISEWYRPMLLHLVVKDENVSMFINGEQVGQITVDIDSLTLSESDWMGFYSYTDFSMFEVDCVSIFPYAVPLQVARKRFVWGQGTDPIELINDSFDGEEAVIQFSNANYSNSKMYPDMERWDAGYYNNLVATTNSISVPEYSLPDIYLGGRDRTEWYSDNNTVNNAEYPPGSHPRFFTFRPNQSTRTNLVANPSFETNTTDWTTSGAGTTISRITTDSKIGTSCVQVNKGAVANGRISSIATAGSRIPVTAGLTYQISAYVKVPLGQPSCSLRIRTAEYRSDNSRNSDQVSSTVTVSDSDGWVRLSFSDTPTSGVTPTVTMAFDIEETTTVAKTYLVDAILFEESSILLPYFDGSYADPTAKAISTSWSGTPNNSVSTMQYWTTEGTNWTEQCYLNFKTMSFVSSPISSIYGIFEVEQEVNYSRPLIHIVNNLNGKRFEININGYDVSYVFDGQELDGTGITVDNTHFAVGFHIPTLSQSFNFELSSFFGSPELLSVFVGGDGSVTFEGKVYRLGFSDQSNFEEISEHFDLATGIVNYDDEALLENHYSSYTLSPFFRYNTYFLDISVSAQWEEYFPLSSFASYITTRDGSRAYDIDYLQINYGYPSLVELVETTVDNPNWIYQELFDDYNDPIQKSYEILDNSILSGYDNYEDLKNNIITEYEIDTSRSSLNAYVTFQLLAEGADEPLSNFIDTKNLTDSYTVYAEEQNTNTNPYKAYKTKFRIIDGTVVYPPKNISFENIAMVLHFDIKQDGIISNPLKVRNLEIAAKSLNENGLTPIGTRSGYNIYPYVKTGIYYDGKTKNPVLMGKDNLPYLYLTEKTGLRVLEAEADKEYGVIIPINQNKSANYSLGAVQMFAKYDVDQVIPTSQRLFSLEHIDGVIDFMITPDLTAKRYYIFARDQRTLAEYSNLTFYQNGISVINPYLIKNEWNSLSFSFNNPLNFSERSGSINMLYGLRFNNVSFFKPTGLNEFKVTIPKVWDDIYKPIERRFLVSQSVTTVDIVNDYIILGVNHNATTGQAVEYQSSSVISGLEDGKIYYSRNINLTTFSLHPTETDAINGTNKVNLSGTPSGIGRFSWIVDWKEWYDENGVLTIPNKWKDLYILDESTEFSITPADIFSAYCGTNIIVSDDDTGMSLAEDYFVMFADQTWLTITQKPI